MDGTKLKADVVGLIKSKSKLKRDVFELSKLRFKELKTCLSKVIAELSAEIHPIDPRLEISFKDLGEYYAQITIAGDTLMFVLHTNVFFFPDSSQHWNSSYLKHDVNRGYCGNIQVYNFLADSIRYNREKDAGYLIARLFLNMENHFFVEGKKELSLIFNNFMHDELTDSRMKDFILLAIKHSITFDLFVPQYQNIQKLSLAEAKRLKDNISLKTGKRLGFQFGLGDDSVEA